MPGAAQSRNFDLVAALRNLCNDVGEIEALARAPWKRPRSCFPRLRPNNTR